MFVDGRQVTFHLFYKSLQLVLHKYNTQQTKSSSSSSLPFNFKEHEMSKSIQIKSGTTRQETALMVALKIHINTNIKHQTVNKAYNIRKTQTANIR